MKIRDIITFRGLTTATLDSTLAEIAVKMRDANMSAIPILGEDDSLAGIVTARDIVVRAIAEGRDPQECTAEEIIGEQLHTIHPDAELAEAAELMAARQIRRLPVVENRVILGLISMDDLIGQPGDEETAEAAQAKTGGAGARQAGKGPQPVTRGRRSEARQTRVASGAPKQAAGHAKREAGKKKVTPIRSSSRPRRRAS